MADKPIKFDDIILLGDGINKLIADFKKLETNVVKSIDNIAKASKTLGISLDGTEESIKNLVDESEKLQKSTDQQSTKLNENAKSLDKLTTEHRQNAQAQKEATIATETLGNSIVDQKKKIKLLQTEYESLDPTIAGNKQKMNQLSKQLVRTRTDVKQLSDASKRMNATFDSSAGSYNDLIKQNKRISQILRKLPAEFLETNKRAQQLQKTFHENTQTLKKFDAQMGQNFRNVGNYGDSLGKLNGLAMGGAKALGALGLAGGVALVGKELFEATKQLEKNQKTMKKLLNVGGKDLEAYTAKASAVAQVFDQEFNMVARATNVLMETFGDSGSESLDLIEQSLIRGVDIQDDFLEQISEYSLFFKEAGLNAQNMVDVMIKGEDKGIFSDKALDAVKEASIRIREMPQTTKDALDALGISSARLERDLANGSKTVADAIAEVSTEMGKLPAQSVVVGTAIADIFGGAGEDAGLAFLLTLKDINSESKDWENNLSDAQKATKEYLDSQTGLNAALVSFGANTDTLTTKLKTFGLTLTTDVLNVLSKLARMFTTAEARMEDFKKQLTETEDIAVLEEQLASLRGDMILLMDGAKEGGAKGLLSRLFFGVSEEEQRKSFNEIGQKMSDIKAKIALIKNTEVQEEEKKVVKVVAANNKGMNDIARHKRQAERDLEIFLLNQQIGLLEQTRDNEEKSLNERLAASDLIEEKKMMIAGTMAEARLDTEKKLIQEEIDLIEAQFSDMLAKASKAGDDFADALFEGLKREAEGGTLDSLYDKGMRGVLLKLETSRNEQLKVIEEGNMSFKDKEQARFETEEEFRRKSLESQLFFLKKKLALTEENSEQSLDIAKRISEAELELSKTTNEQKTINIQDFASAATDVANALINMRLSRFDNELAQLDERAEASATFYDNELSLAGDNEIAKKEINRQRIQDEKKLERERNKILRDQAKAQKRAAIFGAIVSTAQGVAQALNNPYPANLIFAASVAAVGAIEIATIQNEPLPSFAKGVKKADGGLAVVGEKGRELVVDKKSGTAGFTPDKTSLMDVPEGAEIFDAVTTRRMMANPEQLENAIGANETNKNIHLSNASLQYNKNKYLQAMAAQNRPPEKLDYNRLGKAVAENIPPQQIWEIGNDNRVRSFTRHRDGSRTEHRNKEADFISHKNPLVKQVREMEKKIDKMN